MAAVDPLQFTDDPGRQLTKREAAAIAGQSVRTIERWIEVGRAGRKLPVVDYGPRNIRIVRADLDAFLDAFRRSDMIPADDVHPDAST